MFEQAFRNIDDILRKEAGCTTELDYTEQTSWLLFLKYIDGLEQDRATEAKLEGNEYTFLLDQPYRWESWTAPKDKTGKLDHNTALSGDDLRDFVNVKLFPYLHGFRQCASGPNTIEYKVGKIFGEIKNKITSGYNVFPATVTLCNWPSRPSGSVLPAAKPRLIRKSRLPQQGGGYSISSPASTFVSSHDVRLVPDYYSETARSTHRRYRLRDRGSG